MTEIVRSLDLSKTLEHFKNIFQNEHSPDSKSSSIDFHT